VSNRPSQGQTPADRRAATLAALSGETLDVLVIGGGIVGAGIARDAALRGLRTGLIDQHDFAFGTSSRSSRLLHGGLRYLAQGRLRLVREASVEKMRLRQMAPHLVEPLPFLFPTYRGTAWPRWQLRIGVKLYDLLCGGNNYAPSGSLTRGETLRRLPALASRNLTGAVRYFDALTCDARLVLDTLRAAALNGAAVLNYCQLVEARTEGALWRCEVRDHVGSRSHGLQSRAVVNACGAWGDRLPFHAIRLRLTKGIHCVFTRQRLPVPEAVVITEARRLLFVIPWGERVIVGTTDTDYAGALDDVRADPADITYVLRSVNDYFPSLAVTRADVLATWAGLRPLIANPNGTPSDISRAHEIRSPAPGWWDVAGGKLTTYRLMAEQTVDRILHQLERPATPSRTAEIPLLPASDTAAFSGVIPPPVSADAVRHFCEHEWALHLDDVLLRRAGWAYSVPDANATARQVAGWMAAQLGWTPAEQAAELERIRRDTAH